MGETTPRDESSYGIKTPRPSQISTSIPNSRDVLVVSNLLHMPVWNPLSHSPNSKARESILSRSKLIHTYRHGCLCGSDAVSKGRSECLPRATLRSPDDQPNSPFIRTQKPRGDPQTQILVCFGPTTPTGSAARGSDSTG